MCTTIKAPKLDVPEMTELFMSYNGGLLRLQILTVEMVQSLVAYSLDG